MGKNLKGKEIGSGISQRKDGRYVARASINGHCICLYDTNLNELKRRFKEEKEKVAAGDYDECNTITLAEWFEQWFMDIKRPTLKNDVSANSYASIFRNTFIKKLGDKLLSSITQNDIQIATNKILEESKCSPRRVKDGVGIFRECLHSAEINGMISKNPCECIAIKDENLHAERRVMTQNEQDKFLEFAKINYYYELFEFLLLTGLRVGELAALTWDDIDFCSERIRVNKSMTSAYLNGKKILRVDTPKSATGYREVPFFSQTRSVLDSWRAKQDECKLKCGSRWRGQEEFGNLVFTTSLGSPATRYIIAPQINKIVDDINAVEQMRNGGGYVEFKHMHPHAFRHTFITRCHEKGLDPVFIQKIAGHANYATTLSYTHILKSVIDKEIVKAGQFI